MSCPPEFIENGVFFHLSPKDRWQTGQRFATGDTCNRLWSRIRDTDHIHRHAENGIAVDKMIRHAIDVYKGRSPKTHTAYHYDLSRTLEEASDVLLHTLISVRELVFENVRRDHFRQSPSRVHCIWLIPNMQGCLRAWAKAHSGRDFDVLRVRIRGRIQYANARYTEGGTISLKSWEILAQRYWSGERVGEPSTEMLFEGELEVLETMSQPWLTQASLDDSTHVSR